MSNGEKKNGGLVVIWIVFTIISIVGITAGGFAKFGAQGQAIKTVCEDVKEGEVAQESIRVELNAQGKNITEVQKDVQYLRRDTNSILVELKELNKNLENGP